MPLTIDQLRSRLGGIQFDERVQAGITVDDVNTLTEFLAAETWLAARAVLALSRLPQQATAQALEIALRSERPQIRVALAASAKNLTPEVADPILLQLLGDAEIGVRRFAIDSISSRSSPELRGKLQWLARHDRVEMLRQSARERLLGLRLGVYIDFDPAGSEVESEHVIVRNNEDFALDLSGWRIRDRAGHEFDIPLQTVLPPGHEIRIWTKAGQTTNTDLFWGRRQAVWNNNGDTVVIVNGQQQTVCEVRYPNR